ncbi:MAG: hypothetical protein FJX23_10850, partial [Alphaproteobacteria bacterium]|nr:hypothetical protein [Alphaproteobacteria bacterium]
MQSKAKAIAISNPFNAKFWLTAASIAILTGMLATSAFAATPAAETKTEAKTEAPAEEKKANLLEVIEG